jgi:type IV pilus assembly protein PilN
VSGFNLLPWRDERRQRRRQEFRRLLALAALLGCSVVFAVFAINTGRIALQHDRNQRLENENAALDRRIREVRNLQQDIEALNARRASVERLQAGRVVTVHLLDELVQRVPQGVVLKSLKQAERILITGQAQSNSRVSELLHALGGQSRWLGRAELVEVKAGDAGQAREAARLVDFTIALDGPAADGRAP